MLESPQRMLSGRLAQSVLWGRADSGRPGQRDRGEPVQELWWGLCWGAGGRSGCKCFFVCCSPRCAAATSVMRSECRSSESWSREQAAHEVETVKMVKSSRADVNSSLFGLESSLARF